MTTPPAKTEKKKEKRDFFRVNHDLLFDFKVVEAFSAENESPEMEFDDSASVGLVNELRRLDKDNVQTLRLLTEKNRLLGDYLNSLSNKIDLIARHTLIAQETANQDKQKTRINLSEDGLAFLAERALYKDSYIVVRLIFLPQYIPITCFAKVIRCDAKDNNYQVAARFHRIKDSQRQELSKQILKAQTSARKSAAHKANKDTK